MEYIRNNLCVEDIPIKNPRDGAFIRYKDKYYVTLYNCIIDTYGIYIVDKDWSHYYWTPPESYIHPEINWEQIWKEMDYCNHGHLRNYAYSETITGPEIQFYNFKL